MLEQLEAVARKEQELKDARELEKKSLEIEEWRAGRRQQLEKLIEVRLFLRLTARMK